MLASLDSAHGLVTTQPDQIDVTRLYREHRLPVYRLALRYGGGDAAFAEDVLQEVFLRVVRHGARLHDQDDLGGWLRRVTTNVSISRLRRRRVRRALPVRWLWRQQARAPRTPEVLAEARTAVQQVMAAVDLLPAKQKVAFCLYHLEGRSVVEIGEVMGHSKGYVSKLVSRAEDRLRGQGWEPDA